MPKFSKIAFLILLLFSFNLSAQNEERGKTSAFRIFSAAGNSAAATALSNADVAYLRTLVGSNTRGLKGAFGENIAQKTFLDNILSKSGNWKSVTPRLESQGLDHVFVKYNKDGLPKQLMVGESKFGSNRLGFTRDGIQMGREWTNKRLTGLGEKYESLAKETAVNLKKSASAPKYEMEIHLKNGKTAHFWKNSRNANWNFDGSETELSQAKSAAKDIGHFFKSAGNGNITYRSRIFHIEPKGRDIAINIYDAKNIPADAKAVNLKKLTQTSKPLVLKGAADKSSGELKPLIEKALEKAGFSAKTANKMAWKLTNEYSMGQIVKPYSKLDLAVEIVSSSVAAGVFTAAVDAGIQFVFTGEVNLKQTVLTGGAVAAGTLIGQTIKAGLMSQAAQALHLSSSAVSAIAEAAGIGITTAIINYGNWLMGNTDFCTATLDTGMQVGILLGAKAAITGVVAAYGSAGTGVAIGSLSGAAAKSATLAWLGGGSIASGGFGVAGGTVVLGGAVAVAAIALTFAAKYAVGKYDEYAERQKIGELIRIYSEDSKMNKLIENSGWL